MRVAQIAPLYESVPPIQYGGTERVVSYITEELVRQGHDVTLFASGDSLTSAKLIPGYPHALRMRNEENQGLIPHLLMVEEVRKRADDFDFLHFHIDHLHYPIIRTVNTPSLTTLHGRLDLPFLIPLYLEYSESALSSISNSQRTPLPWLNWKANVYHGLPTDLYKFINKPRGNYAAFIGRISPEKRPDRAIEIAQRACIPLKIAAKVDKADKKYFEEIIRPILDRSRDVEFLGEISDDEKNDFLGNAKVLLFPIDWPEPFGLVMIESLACGTPVIAFENGSVKEIIRHGINGYVVNSIDEAVQCTENIGEISRKQCRKDFENRFSVKRMVDNYLDVYRNIIAGHDEIGYMVNDGWEKWKISSSTIINSI